jgi:glycosyltransferase involved in cell wall biosynthesis
MKILFAIQYYAPAWAYGGPPRLAYDLAKGLARNGHEVTVCTTDALDRGSRLPTGEADHEGIRVFRFPNLSNALAFHMKIFLPRGVKGWLKTHVGGFDVVHLFDARSWINAWATDEATKRQVPLVWSVWGSLPRGIGWRAALKTPFDRKHLSQTMTWSKALLAQNDHEALEYQEFGGRPEQIVLWPVAIDADEFAPLPARGPFRQKHKIPADAPLVLFVGRLSVWKGLDPLLRAFALVLKKVPNAHLAVVGRDDGFEAPMLALAKELGITSQFTFAGPLYGRDVVPAYVDCDLFCITPTHFEETSLASLTACACARPVLINDRCGIPWLDDYDAGRCVPHSIERIASEMIGLLGDRGRLEVMGKNARRMIEERFALGKVVEQLEGVYRDAKRNPR